MLSNKPSNNVKVSALLTSILAAAISTGAAFAGSSTTVTWNFSQDSNGHSGKLGSSATFTASESPTNSLGYPLNNDLSIATYGEKVTTTQKLKNNGQTNGSANYHSKAQGIDLYGKNGGGAESGLGLNGFTDHEISDTTPKAHDHNSYETYQTGVVQIDLTNILAFLGAGGNDATLTIGSLQSPDEAIISVSDKLGTIGTQIGTVSSGNGSDQSTTISLGQLNGKKYLNITAAAAGQAGSWCQPGTPGQTVLLSTLTLNVPTQGAIPAGPVPVPASAGLLAVGGLALLPMLVRRRKMVV